MIEQKMQTATAISIIRTVVYPKEPIAAPNPPDVGDGMIELDVEGVGGVGGVGEGVGVDGVGGVGGGVGVGGVGGEGGG